MNNKEFKIPDIEDLQKEFKDVIIEVLAYLKEFSKYDVLSYFYWDYKISHFSKEDCDNNIIWLKNMKIMYLQMLFFCIDNTNEYKEFKDCDIKKLDEYIKKIYSLISQYGFIIYKDSDLSEADKEYLSHSYAFKDWSGKRYDIFEIQHHKDLLECLRKEFEEMYKFSLDELYLGISNLKKSFYFKFEKSYNQIIKSRESEKIKIDESGIKYNNLNSKEIELLEECINDVHSLELANLNTKTKWPNDFLDRFVLPKEEYQNFLKNISIEKWNHLSNQLKYKPIIIIEGNHYLLLQSQFYDNLDRGVLKRIREGKTKSEKEEIKEKYTYNIEKIVAGYLNKIFTNIPIYINNYYDYEKRIIENDILIVFDNNVFIVEVKSGSFTPELADEDYDSHIESLQSLIEKANEQQNGLEQDLIEKKKVVFYDSNNKKIRKQKFEVEINEDTRIFKIIVTAEFFNDIEARLDKVKIISVSDNTLALSLDDLRVYSDYFEKHPCYFIQYLLQRMKAIGNKNVDLYDELYHLGMWIDSNHYNEKINERVEALIEETNDSQIGEVFLSGEDWIKEIDDYYNDLFFKKRNIEKPLKKLPLELEKIINYCETNIPFYTYTFLTTFLLNLNPDTKERTAKIINESRTFFKDKNRPKYVYMTLVEKDENKFDAICITAVYGEKDINEDDLIPSVYANMYLSKAHKLLNVFLYYSSDLSIKKISTKILSSNDNDAKTTEIIYLAEEMAIKRRVKIECKKVGRNDLCPCGSRKKI